ncbi:hypothetical protein DSM25558_5459 [Agrobacterium sp. DSM 25558]|uniref:Uncharacterized protein n=1 Tax=Agrobacterium rosae TaxID=1972867 RepID=A0A1R3U3V4_9HYPH|nr:hypothetical protein DSM25558_5459 [Agrobacterium sp. DSM 25558]SCX36369.1 hypothetical protein DSM25559_5450 [Agrobacterium rosae]
MAKRLTAKTVALPCRASPPQGGRSVKGTLTAQHHPSGEGKITKYCHRPAPTFKMSREPAPSQSPHVRGRLAGQRGVSGVFLMLAG